MPVLVHFHGGPEDGHDLHRPDGFTPDEILLESLNDPGKRPTRHNDMPADGDEPERAAVSGRYVRRPRSTPTEAHYDWQARS
jgi:hypothetical protein